MWEGVKTELSAAFRHVGYGFCALPSPSASTLITAPLRAASRDTGLAAFAFAFVVTFLLHSHHGTTEKSATRKLQSRDTVEPSRNGHTRHQEHTQR